MGHCNGGTSTVDSFDILTTIVDWVENAKVPDRLIARKIGAGGAPTRSRPLCSYPQHAVYNGAGSIDDADSFACRPEPPR